MLVECKTIKMDGKYIYFWNARNKGVSKNTTIILSSSCDRAAKSRDQTQIIATIKKNNWAGKIWLTQSERKMLGLC